MIAWSRMKTLLTGCALILAANAVALLGVAHNRSDADSSLRLNQRELRAPYAWRATSENSGISLTLHWQMPMAKEGDTRYGNPAWLDETKLAALGFRLPAQDGAAAAKQRSKAVLLVLELDGPARELALQRLRQRKTNEEALLAANPGKKEFENRAKLAQNRLAQEENGNSRLYLIDAGLDHGTLRTQYPDRARYAIIRGTVRPSVVKRDNDERLIGTVGSLSSRQINVPREFQHVLSKRPEAERQPGNPQYQFEVAFGQRLEPWIVSAMASP
ncbi:MAG: hypothetical protein H6R01_1286 [Burkholderiaceae bacterium]|nr:hypothetical protein [Burkholderiaceae bacterium]